MKCQLCSRNKAFLVAYVGKAKVKVCIFCAITDQLEILEAIDVRQARMEEGDKEETELHLSSMRKEGNKQDS